MESSFSQEDIAEMDIKDLNRMIKANKLTNEDSKSVKDMRRKMKMRAYGVKNRQRKKDEYQALQKQRQCLVMELGELQQEVYQLREMKNQFAYQSDYRSDEDENVDICC
eukprot:TRINITY_DN537_c0_g1_i1.p1 TRINITY_DN537_c0_g1~~TRINITY_DN537_c0_g1_i1.p1  ORF type:complete len:109 (-),score=24.01 TRINITY_DN537_c0_g1_i1:102-428(-)